MGHSLAELKAAIIVCIQNGKFEEAFDVCCIALKDERAGHEFKVYLSHILPDISGRSFNPIIKNAIFRSISDPEIDSQKLSKAWAAILKKDPEFEAFFLFANEDYEFQIQDWENFEYFLNNQFLLVGLKNIIIDDEEIELCLRNIRKITLLNLHGSIKLKTRHINFLCALAEQCFNNEYVYFVSEEEKTKLDKIELDCPINIALKGCYLSLRDVEFNYKISILPSFKRLLDIQILQPKREFFLYGNIISLGAINEKTSKKVRDMYEENPYPRWRAVDKPAQSIKNLEAEILIAGAGTGRYAINLSFAFPNANITAIDISKSSLAYLARMSETHKSNCINILHCDILDVGKINNNFDYINCTGVLHHMENPILGWKELIKKLKVGGFMLIGLYSTKARNVIFDAHDYIKKNGYTSDPDGIRALRKDMFRMSRPGKFDRLKISKDFYSMSDVRDLLFHIQETTFTIPLLKQTLDSLGLEFMGFKFPDLHIRRTYQQMFPDDALMIDLDNWDKLENQYPHAFGRMYNLLCCKKNESLNSSTQTIINSGFLGL